MIDIALNWLDALWIPLALIFLAKHQKIKGALFILLCMIALRLQVELFNELGYPDGFLPLWDFPIMYRGYIVYGLFIFGFLLLGHVSKERNSFVYMAAGISIFILAFCISLVTMSL